MAITQADLDSLNTAILSGELTVRTNDRLVTYHSKADMIAAYNHAKSVFEGQSTQRRMPARHQIASFSDD